MSFHATNFTVTLLLLLCFTVFTMGYRQTRPMESNVPAFYWLMAFFFTLVRAEETFDFRYILLGVSAGFILRFEFMNRFLTRVVRWVEMGVWLYILYRGFQILFFV